VQKYENDPCFVSLWSILQKKCNSDQLTKRTMLINRYIYTAVYGGLPSTRYAASYRKVMASWREREVGWEFGERSRRKCRLRVWRTRSWKKCVWRTKVWRERERVETSRAERRCRVQRRITEQTVEDKGSISIKCKKVNNNKSCRRNQRLEKPTQRKLSKNIVLELRTLFLNWEHWSWIENIRS